MENPSVAVLLGSKSDEPKVQGTKDTLDKLEVPYVMRVMSAHRTPARVADFVERAPEQGIKVFIAAAGGAAHLAGQVAAHTTLPVVGIPVEGGALNGLDALYSTVQMPGGMPVATGGIGKGGAKNAALLAVQILAVENHPLQEKIASFREQQRQQVIEDDEELQRGKNQTK